MFKTVLNIDRQDLTVLTKLSGLLVLTFLMCLQYSICTYAILFYFRASYFLPSQVLTMILIKALFHLVYSGSQTFLISRTPITLRVYKESVPCELKEVRGPEVEQNGEDA